MFMLIQIGDWTKGSNVGGPVHMVSEEGADKVVFEALFNADDPLFYMELRNEDQYYIFGHLWMDGSSFNDDKKFTTKLASIRIEVPRKDWDEFKDYRVRFWKAGKVWAGAEDKKDDKKDKKEGEGEDGDKKEGEGE